MKYRHKCSKSSDIPFPETASLYSDIYAFNTFSSSSLSIIDQGHWSTHLPTPGPIHPIDANFYRFHQLIQYPLCLHPNPPLHLPNQFFIVSPFCLFLRSCLEAACKGSKVGKHGDNEVAGANIEGQHFVPKRQTLSPIYALAKILKEYLRLQKYRSTRLFFCCNIASFVLAKYKRTTLC